MRSPTSDGIRAALAQQAASPVRWVETVPALAARGVTDVVECGPGKVLGGLIKRIDRTVATFAIGSIGAFDAALAEVGRG